MAFPVVMYGWESWTIKTAEVKSLSCVRLFATLWTVSMGFSRQEYWSGLPFSSPGESTIWATREVSKKAEYWRIDAFELWSWRRLLRAPWTARRSNQSILNIDWKSVLNIHWKYWCWSWSSNILATWCEELTHWKRPWCWERLKVGGERDNRGWDGWMASLTRWTWVWASSRSWWGTGKPGMQQSMRLQRVGHDWTNELIWTENGLIYITILDKT